MTNKAYAYAEMGLPAAKLFPNHVRWDQMQKGPYHSIDFTKMDSFVREYQKKGFSELVLCLKPHSRWGSKNVGRFISHNASPKPRYLELFIKWVQKVVERYDGDGKDDMPGLRWPIRYLEIGSEFSSYQPESAQEYIGTLSYAYQAAQRASDKILVAHSEDHGSLDSN